MSCSCYIGIVRNKWKILIIRDLLGGTMRFGKLKHSIGTISQKVLTSNLRAMESDGLIIRTIYAEVPPKVEYSLTELGRSILPIIDSMYDWGDAYSKSYLKN